MKTLVKRILRKMERTSQPTPTCPFILTDLILQRLSQKGERFVVIDGGARDALHDPRWARIGSRGVTLYGFEVDAKECENLNAQAKARGLDMHYVPVGLWSEDTEIDFFETAEPGGSSFYRPNIPYLARLAYWADGRLGETMNVVDSHRVRVTTLKSWMRASNVRGIDFIKLNVQGAELPILRGMGTELDNVIGLQLELSFGHTYVDAPTFSDVDSFLRAQGFTFFDLLAPNYVGRIRSPIRYDIPQAASCWPWPSRQLFEGHFLYFRDPINNSRTLPLESALKLAACAEMWGQLEFAFEVLAWLGEAATDIVEAAIPRYATLSGAMLRT